MVVHKFVDEMNVRLKKKKVTLSLDEKAVEWIATEGYDEAYGARPIKRLIEEKVHKPLSEELLFGKLAKGGVAKISVKDGKLDFKY